MKHIQSKFEELKHIKVEMVVKLDAQNENSTLRNMHYPVLYRFLQDLLSRSKMS